MNKHCKGCLKHHSAGHPKGSALAAKYNDWCCWRGSTASKAIGHCKQRNAKQETAVIETKT